MKTGLILEGGAMRGMFTCGVLDVLAENHIRFDGAAGISAGAVFGCNYKSGQIGRAVRYNKAYSRDRRYCSLWSLVTTGDLYGADFCYRELPDVLDPFDRAAFRANPMEFWIGATDVASGRCLYHRCTDGGEADMLWMRASASMPALSRPVEVDGLRLLDGGIADPVPYAHMEALGYDRNVIVLTRPRAYRKEKAKGLPLIRLLLRKTPRIAEAMAVRHRVYNRQMDALDAREDGGLALVIRPPEPLGISRTEKDPDELERVYQLGRREGLRRLDEVRAWLDGRP
ncbi:MAG: patatin family protein [Eubacteriales bacterium]|nr:patatin family protein [Eubacteriales bacterium]